SLESTICTGGASNVATISTARGTGAACTEIRADGHIQPRRSRTTAVSSGRSAGPVRNPLQGHAVRLPAILTLMDSGTASQVIHGCLEDVKAAMPLTRMVTSALDSLAAARPCPVWEMYRELDVEDDVRSTEA